MGIQNNNDNNKTKQKTLHFKSIKKRNNELYIPILMDVAN